MGFEFGEVIRLREQVKEFEQASKIAHEKVANRIALLAIRKVKKMTPVGDTGDLRRNWKHDVVKKGDEFIIVIHNIVEYASWVELGHRIVRDGVTLGWVEGRFMLKLTEEAMEKIAPRMWKNEVEKEMRRIFGG